MIKTFTPNDVLRYTYGEIFLTQEKEELEAEIIKSDELSDVFFQTTFMMKALDEIKREPSDRTIEEILNFSRSFKYSS